MKSATINRATYLMTPTGKGQYMVEKITNKKMEKRHSTDSIMYDWMDDDSDKKQYLDARRKLRKLFSR